MEDDLKLYFEEQRQLLIDFNKGFVTFSNLLQQNLETGALFQKDVAVKGSVSVNTEKEVTIQNLHEFVDSVKGFGEVVAEAIKNNAYKPTPLVVSNIKDARTSAVEITNFDDLKTYFDKLATAVKNNKPIFEKQEVIFPTDPKKPISVRLSDGKAFYNAIAHAVSGGMGVQSALTRNSGTAIAVVNEDGTPISGGASALAKPTDAYKYCASSTSGAYDYAFYESADGDWYIAREVIATGYIDFTAGTGGIGTVYDSSTTAPIGSLTYGTYAEVF